MTVAVDSTDRRIVMGAAWMIGARVADRTIGFISVAILARVLVPADFGLIAMATAVVALVETLGAFSFDWALVRDPNLDDSKLNTAWTLRMLVGVALATLIAVAGQAAIHFYDEPRLGPVALLLAGAYLMSTAENIGTMYFRRELAFDKEFVLRFCGKIAGFAATVPAAFVLRSYWALLFGIVAQKGTIVVLSYFMHPYRPKLDLSRSRTLLGFSMWLQLNGILDLARSRLPDFILGRLSGAQSVGLYSVANEIAHLPSTELIAPINRAVFPGYARQVLDKGPLAATFLNVVGLVWVIALPAALGIAAVAPLLVAVLLGQQWLGVIPILQVLALSAVGFVLSTNVTYIFLAVGKPKLTTVVNLATALLFVPGLIYLTHRHGAIGAAYAYGLTALTMLPINYGAVCVLLKLRVWRIAAATWRPLAAALVMNWVVRSLPEPALTGGSLTIVPALAMQVAVGAAVYLFALAALWLIVGRPAGAESAILDFVRRKRKT